MEMILFIFAVDAFQITVFFIKQLMKMK